MRRSGRTLKWMCGASPAYQPGTMVRNVHRPAASVTWVPRRNVEPPVEYSPETSACHTSTAAPRTGRQPADAPTTVRSSRNGTPSRPSLMSDLTRSRSR